MNDTASNRSGALALRHWPSAHQAVFLVIALTVAGFYLVCVRSFHGRFIWDRDQPGYYGLLGRAFATGHLSLPLQPRPELLALPDPWDPAQNAAYMQRDLALYNGKYYLYHGVTPVCLLFAPYRFIFHHDMPEHFAAYLFCVLTYLSCCGIVIRLWSAIDACPGLLRWAVLLLAMGICNALPFLLTRVLVYEIALTAGCFCVSTGFYFLALWLTGGRRPTALLALAGLMLGLAIGCRPHLALAALFGGMALWWYLRVERLAFAAATRLGLALVLPIAVCSLLLAAYNYARFSDPFEFGVRYVMASAEYYRFSPSFRNLGPGLYYLLACPPDFEPVFPFIRLVSRTHFHFAGSSLPSRYFLEAISGVFPIWPLAWIGIAAPALAASLRNRAVTALLSATSLFALFSVLSVATLGLATHRFHADWLPCLVTSTCFILGTDVWHLGRLKPWAGAICGLALLYSVAANLVIAVQGPDDMFVQVHPAEYVKFARWFSPVARFRPLFDPPLSVEAAFEFPAKVAPGRLPLVAAGRFGSRYILWAEMLGRNRLRLTSATAPNFGTENSIETDAVPDAPNRLRLEYRPEAGRVSVNWNGNTILRHGIPFLVTAPEQVTVGEDRAEIEDQSGFFPGRVSGVSIVVDGLTRAEGRP